VVRRLHGRMRRVRSREERMRRIGVLMYLAADNPDSRRIKLRKDAIEPA
jgi:hypothetical protein